MQEKKSHQIENEEITPDNEQSSSNHKESLSTTHGEAIDPSPSKKEKKKIYKKPLFWVGLVAATVGVVSISMGLWYRSNVLALNKASGDGWFAITAKSDEVVVSGNKLSETKDFSGYSIKLHELNSLTKDKKFESSKLSGFLTDTTRLQKYKSFLNDFEAYSGEAATMSDEIENFSQDDGENLSDLATTADSASSNFSTSVSGLRGTMPNKIFEISDVLQDQRDAIDTKKKAEENSRQAAASAAAKEAADKKAVNEAVNGFLQGFIAADSAKMRKFMTQGFQNEYNFAQLTPENRQFTFPSTFRIIEATKNTDGSYRVRANVVYKNTDNPNQYTQGYEYSLIYSSSASAWLINDEKVGGGF